MERESESGVAAPDLGDERLFRLIVEATPSAIVMVDTRGLVVLVNAQTELLFGYSRDELLGTAVERLIPERLRAHHRRHRDEFLACPDTRAMGAGRDLYGLRKDGSEIPIEIGLNPLETDDGLFVLASIIDITERKRSEERLLRVVEAAPNAMVMINDQGHIALVNSQTSVSFGYTRDELLSMMVESLIPERFRPLHESSRGAFFARPNRREMGAGRELFGRRKDGSEFPIEIGLNPIQIRDESFVLASIIDITERVSAQKVENAARQDLLRRSILDSLPFSIIATDPTGTIVAANPAAEDLLGYTDADLVGSSIAVVQSGQSHDDAAAAVLSQLAGHEREWTYHRKDGSQVPVNEAVTPMATAEGESTGFLTVAYDITQRIQAQAEVHHLARHDVLTDLPNRTTLLTFLADAISRSSWADGAGIVVVLLDLDHFKRVNDSLGHHIGDELLLQVAERLRCWVRAEDMVARLGGDEFVIVFDAVPQFDGVNDITARLEAFRHEVLGPVTIGDHELHVTASAGGAIYPRHGTTPAELLKSADTAMYYAKAEGRNNFQWFFESMLDETHDKIALSAALRQALTNNDLSLVYQPLISLTTGDVVAVEALARWHDPSRGHVTPGRFIPVAEDGGMIAQLGEWALRRACEDVVAIRERLGRDIRLAVNVSPRQIQHRDWLAVVDGALSASGLNPALLELEVTEGILMEDPGRVVGALASLRQRGIKIVVDDFGTGYSSLSYLTRFPIDKIKIDRSFVHDLAHDDADAAIVNTIIAMAHTLGMGVVAEGVETAEQVRYLQRRGCDEVQGFYFSAGVPIDDLASTVDRIATTDRAPEESPLP